MTRVIGWMMFCAILHIGPPIIFLTLLVSDPATAHDLTPWALLWTMATLAYDYVRMRGYRD